MRYRERPKAVKYVYHFQLGNFQVHNETSCDDKLITDPC